MTKYSVETKLKAIKLVQESYSSWATATKYIFTLSMSRKDNYHNNAPAKTIFNLMKRNKLNRLKIHSLIEMRQVLRKFIY